MKNQIKNAIKSNYFLRRIYSRFLNVRNVFKSLYFYLISSCLIFKNKKTNFNSNQLDKGYLYIVFGKQYFQECIKSVEILKNYSNLPIHLFTDQKEFTNYQKELFFSISVVPKIQIRSKVDYIGLSPFLKTIYLDSDIIISKPIDELFDLLNYYNFIGTLDVARKRQNISESIPEYKKIPYAFGEINGGILGFNQYAKEKIINNWPKVFYKYYQLTGGWDQPSLRILLWRYKALVYILPPEFNVRSKNLIKKVKSLKDKLGKDHMMPRIYHMHVVEDINKIENYPDLSTEEIIELAKLYSYEINY